MKIEEIKTIIEQNSGYAVEQFQIDNLTKLHSYIKQLEADKLEMAKAIVELSPWMIMDSPEAHNKAVELVNKATKYLGERSERD